ncbi:hypothetical protein EVAR_25889_1 [Eumeta japonica]|uniref:Uncharacterized protein n=1 Tax=Eumeta variegata TaxID=151549 RepID=A0A4C1W4T6_EUMVA|nr:hypothetical protein EVAR_25889_1 [Eumeta japonica]
MPSREISADPMMLDDARNMFTYAVGSLSRPPNAFRCVRKAERFQWLFVLYEQLTRRADRMSSIQLSRATQITDLLNGHVEVTETPEVELDDFKEFWLTWFESRIRIGLDSNFRPLATFVSVDKTNIIGYIKFQTRSEGAPRSIPVDWKVEDTPLIPSIPSKRISGGSLQWVRFEDELPLNAVIGGVEGVPVYVARAYHARSLAPGKYRPDTRSAYIAWGHLSHKKTEFEVLCGFDFEWRRTQERDIPLNAVIGGYSEVGQTPLYIGRAYYDGHLLVGKVHTLYSACFLPYKDREVEVHDYEIMISRLCAPAVSLLLGRIDRWSGREIARSVLSLARSAQAERDNESCFFVRAAGVHRFIRRSSCQ